ncbi:MAG: hypothetical protein RLZ39_1401 [Bacteroidota bacterium]|jgi:hypothetical protein
MVTINYVYHLLALLSIFISVLLLLTKKVNKVNNIIINVVLMHSFFEVFLWLIPNQSEPGDIGALCYDVLFPLYIINLILLRKYNNFLVFIVITTTIASQYLVTPSLLPKAGEFKIILSFTSCLTLLMIVYKNLKKISYQTIMLILLSGIPFIDMFFNAAIFRFITFEMNTWKIFLSFYIVYLSITCSIFIYYYGRQLFKH